MIVSIQELSTSSDTKIEPNQPVGATDIVQTFLLTGL
jgi:hypothetical protein